MDWQCFQAVTPRLTQVREEKKVTRLEPFWIQFCDSFLTLSPSWRCFLLTTLCPNGKIRSSKNLFLLFPKMWSFLWLTLQKTIISNVKMRFKKCLSFPFKSIFLFITYYHNLDYPTKPKNKKIIKEYHYYILDDREHNTLFV